MTAKENRLVNLRDMPKKPKTVPRPWRKQLKDVKRCKLALLEYVLHCVALTLSIADKSNCTNALHGSARGEHQIEVLKVEMWQTDADFDRVEAKDLGLGNKIWAELNLVLGWCLEVYALFREDIKEEVPTGKGEGLLGSEGAKGTARLYHVTYGDIQWHRVEL